MNDEETKKLRQRCDDLAASVSSLRQSSGNLGSSGWRDTEQNMLDLTSALRQLDGILRSEYSDSDISDCRTFLCTLFFGQGDPTKGPVPSYVPEPKTYANQTKGLKKPIDRANEAQHSTTNQTQQAPQQPKQAANVAVEIADVPGLIYRPNYITQAEESNLITLIDGQPWDHTLHRRTQQYGFIYDYNAVYEKDATESRLSIGKPIPIWIDKLCTRLNKDGHCPWKPDQVIINEYNPGQGITPHIDHIISFKEVVVSLSLDSGVYMEFSHPKTKKVVPVYLQPRSIVILTGDARSTWRHGIQATVTDLVKGKTVLRRRRVSITFRKASEEETS